MGIGGDRLISAHNRERISNERLYGFLGVQLFPGYRPMGLSRIQACTEIYTWRGEYGLSKNRASTEQKIGM